MKSLPNICEYRRPVLLLNRGKEWERLKSELLLPHKGERVGEELADSLHETSSRTESEDWRKRSLFSFLVFRPRVSLARGEGGRLPSVKPLFFEKKAFIAR